MKIIRTAEPPPPPPPTSPKLEQYQREREFMLAMDYQPGLEVYPCFVQPKLNGIRAKSRDGVYWSRRGTLFPSEVTAHLPKLPEGITFDGELYRHGWNLQRITGAVTPQRSSVSVDTEEIQYYAFDIVDTKLRQEERLSLLAKLLASGQVRMVNTEHVIDADEATHMYDWYVRDGLEGMIYRHPHALYEYGRSKYLLKRKDFKDAEVAVIGCELGEGECKGLVGALICNLNGVEFRLGTGFTMQQRKELLQTRPGTIKIRYLALSDEGKPLNASLL